MLGTDVLQVLSRWLHVGSAIVMIGGVVFWQFALLPAARTLNDSDRETLGNEVGRRWKFFVHGPITLLILTGIYNIVARFQNGGPVVAWHMLVGIKILVALFIMFVLSALVGRSRALAPMRQQPAVWMSTVAILAAIVVLLSVILTRLPKAG